MTGAMVAPISWMVGVSVTTPIIITPVVIITTAEAMTAAAGAISGVETPAVDVMEGAAGVIESRFRTPCRPCEGGLRSAPDG